MKDYNIYFGTIGKKLGVRYRYTASFKNTNEALNHAKTAASSLYYKYEGKYGIPSFSDISKESELTGLDIETLYNDHINDMCRWFVIPTELDSISTKNLN